MRVYSGSRRKDRSFDVEKLLATWGWTSTDAESPERAGGHGAAIRVWQRDGEWVRGVKRTYDTANAYAD